MKKDTILANAGRRPEDNHGIVNPPVYHASTVTFPTVAALEAAIRTPFDQVYYGRFGTPTTFALEEAVAALEGGDRAISLPSGLGAVTVALMAFLEAGDHLLMTDSVYNPTRKLCDGMLRGFGVETTYYDPMIGGGIAELIRPDTRAVFVESPGSLGFEVQDIPAIALAAHACGAVVIMDNTWSSGLYFNAFGHGVDVSVQAATKYIVGHADAMLGIVTTTHELYKKVKTAAVAIGSCAGPDDCYLGLRGLRSLSVRLARHQQTALALARWLAERPEVGLVLHPALAGCPGHDLWRRDFTGASGLFGVVLKEGYAEQAVAAMLDGLKLYAMGFSWGGFESLILPLDPARSRTAAAWPHKGRYLRIHAGLEDQDDLISDLEQGLERLNAF
ncbi:MAG: cystathionine beta-lyase [Rhodospirillales bacterium RIFCSPLOWO2_12_FULL_58_28]|nr:MAG: cystathionine beta-lyase [Rhodospirillales bacterium RIFCSPLOWO2_02_FULL_58_16]OHC79089.1 MAG: cystathionine beta-lyase [Rhodospirillales bacterium RIFCSPLOWO2_12_FULL_58_28]